MECLRRTCGGAGARMSRSGWRAGASDRGFARHRWPRRAVTAAAMSWNRPALRTLSQWRVPSRRGGENSDCDAGREEVSRKIGGRRAAVLGKPECHHRAGPTDRPPSQPGRALDTRVVIGQPRTFDHPHRGALHEHTAAHEERAVHQRANNPSTTTPCASKSQPARALIRDTTMGGRERGAAGATAHPTCSTAAGRAHRPAADSYLAPGRAQFAWQASVVSRPSPTTAMTASRYR